MNFSLLLFYNDNDNKKTFNNFLIRKIYFLYVIFFFYLFIYLFTLLIYLFIYYLFIYYL